VKCGSYLHFHWATCKVEGSRKRNGPLVIIRVGKIHLNLKMHTVPVIKCRIDAVEQTLL
jgi:hypothetical protein